MWLICDEFPGSYQCILVLVFGAVLESEVQDLRVCLKSADKELKEVREEKREEKRLSDLKITNYIEKVGGLDEL